MIERLGNFEVVLPTGPATPPSPDFSLALVPADAPKVYATRGVVPIAVARVGGLTDAVGLDLDSLGSDVTGTLSPNPVDGGTAYAQLSLAIPARYAAGGLVPLRVRGAAGTRIHFLNFVQRIEPLFTLSLSPANVELTSSHPIDVDVTMAFDPFGPFSLTGPGRIDWSVPDLPPGVTAEFLPDASQVFFGAVTSIRRTLRLSTDGGPNGGIGTMQVRATLASLEADAAGQRPFVESTLQLAVTAGQLWEYVENGASYVLTTSDAVGIALQSNDQPAIAWLERRTPTQRQVYLKRFDGTTFVPSPAPGPANGLAASGGGDIEEARLAMTRGDVAHVAFVYRDGAYDGAGLAVGSAGASWTVRSEVVAPGGMHVRSPRIAGAGDALALSYILEADATASSRLFVKGSTSGVPGPLAGPRLDGAINAAEDGRVVRGATALALRGDGQPWAAWIEQPAAAGAPPALWLSSYSGAAWSTAIEVPTKPTLVTSSLQLIVDGAGQVVVSWLEAKPAQHLIVKSLDPASGRWTYLSQGNGDNSLNVNAGQDARDVALTIDRLGRVVVAWTEGGASPRLWVKRQNADGTWALLGTALSDDATTKSPYLVSDSNSRLYLTYTRFQSGDLLTVNPDTDIFVTRWRFP